MWTVKDPSADLGATMRAHTTLSISGTTRLAGSVKAAGSKNFAPKALVAALLTTEPCTLHNIPDILDTGLMCDLISLMGVSVNHLGSTVEISAEKVTLLPDQTLKEYSSKSRIPILLASVNLLRNGVAKLELPGGCAIGARALDFHVMVLKAFGATAIEKEGCITFSAPNLTGTSIVLPYPSVGATEQAILCAAGATGVSIINNAAVEPEIQELCSLLQSMGAKITQTNKHQYTILGTSHLKGYNWTCHFDRLEAASWACAALGTDGYIEVRGAYSEPLLPFLSIFTAAGGAYTKTNNGLSFYRQKKHILPVNLRTDPWPGFSTDWQPPLAVALTAAHGTSFIHETVYEDRLGYAASLVALGANCTVYENCHDLGFLPCRFASKQQHLLKIIGPTELCGTNLVVPDLRAGFSLIIAALMASDTTVLSHAEILFRGYDNLLPKLTGLGAEFTVY